MSSEHEGGRWRTYHCKSGGLLWVGDECLKVKGRVVGGKKHETGGGGWVM